MAQPLLDVFFYGLFMDQQVLGEKGVRPVDIRLASAQRIGLPSHYVASIADHAE